MKKEIRFGIIAVGTAALIFIGLNYLAGSQYFGPPMVLYANYPKLNGLFAGNQVYIKGVPVGKVADVELEMTEGFQSGYTRVRMELDKKYNIPANSEAMVYSIDLLGAKGIEIRLPDSLRPAGTFLENGDDITGAVESGIFSEAEDLVMNEGAKILLQLGTLTVQLNEIVAAAKKVIADDRYTSSLAVTLENIRETTDNLTKISQEVDSISRELRVLSGDAASIVSNFENNNENISRIIANVESTTDSLESASSEIKKLMTDASSAVGSVENIVTKLDTTTGTLGLLLNDRELYDSLTYTTRNVNALLREVNENPERFFDDIKIYLIERRKKEEAN